LKLETVYVILDKLKGGCPVNDILNLNKIGEGQDSEVYSLDNNRVIKLFRNSKDDKVAIHEMKILKTIDNTGISVPKVYEYIHTAGRPGFIMGRVDGNSIISVIERKPYLMVRMSKVFAKSHSEIHKIDAPIEIPLIKEELKNCIKTVNCLTDEIIEYTLKLLN
jgi:RIO-like serine/threonine protein kinase